MSKDELTDKTYLFEKMPISHAVAKLCIPTVIGSLVTMIYSLADTFFVGMLSDPVENAAVTLAAPVLLAFNAVNNLFGVGTSSMMSRALGNKDHETVRRSSATGIWGAMIMALIFSLSALLFRYPLLNLLGCDATTIDATNGYMFWTVICGALPCITNVVFMYLTRSEGSALHASIGVMSGCILNIILDPFFILPKYLGMGAAGAGLATFISNSFAVTYFLILTLVIKRGKTFVCLDPRKISFNKEILGGIAKVGIPASIQNLLNVTGMTILNNFTSEFGADAIAAMGIAQKMTTFTIYVCMGISQGVMPLVGYNYSAKNYKRMKEAIYFVMKVSLAILVTIMIFYIVFPSKIISIFIKNESVIRYGSTFLKCFAFSLPFMPMDFLGVNVFQACGMGKEALIFAVLRKIVLEIPLLIILNRLLPLYGLPLAQPITEFFLALAALYMIRKIVNEKK